VPGQEIEVIHAGLVTGDRVRRRAIGLDGQILDTDRAFPLQLNAGENSLAGILYPESGRTVLALSPYDATLEFYIFPPPSAPEEETVVIATPPGWKHQVHESTLATGHDQIALVGYDTSSDYPWPIGTRWVRVHDEGTGKLNWQKRVPTPASFEVVTSLLASELGWVLVQATATELHLNHFSAGDGSLLMQRVLPFEELIVDGASTGMPLVTFAAAAGAVIVVSALPDGVRVHWVDDLSGELRATATSPIRRHHAAPLPTTQPDGSLLVSGQASGASYPAPALLKVTPASRQAIFGGEMQALNGAWFDPTTTGQGWFFDVVPEQGVIFGAWFTFERLLTSGQAGLRWYTMQGSFPEDGGVAELTMYRNVGGLFEAGPATQPERVGIARLWTTASGNVQMDMDFVAGAQPIRTGQDLTRAMPVDAGDGVRHWFDPEIAGQGIVLAQPLDAQGALFGGWFTYDTDTGGETEDPTGQHWFTIQGPASTDSELRAGTIYRTTGGSLATGATRNTDPVGTILFSRLTCDRLLVDFNFDRADETDPFFGRAGQRELIAIAGCPGAN